MKGGWLVVVSGCSLASPSDASLTGGQTEADAGYEVGAFVDEPNWVIGPPIYTVDADLVRDARTGLEWQRVVSKTRYKLDQVASACAGLELAGHKDFRVPTRSELLSIVDFGLKKEPATDATAFPDTPHEYTDLFWTSTPAVGIGSAAWTIAFYDGVAVRRAATTLAVFSLRCVRGGAMSSGARFETSADAALDRRTSLRWRRSVETGLHAQSAAAEICRAVPGHRLPTILELQTIVDARRRSPATDPEVFPATPRETFWASSGNVALPYYGWAVNFDTGEPVYAEIHTQFRVRCVQ